MCKTCAERPIRYKRSAECANCYNRRYRNEHREQVRAYQRGKNREFRRKHQGVDSTADIPDIDLTKPVTYQTAHQRVYRWRGAARIHACEHCGSGARDWAYTHDGEHELITMVAGWSTKVKEKEIAYSPDPRDYIPLCRSCHVKFDLARVA